MIFGEQTADRVKTKWPRPDEQRKRERDRDRQTDRQIDR